jgi:uncharacterized protein YcfL
VNKLVIALALVALTGCASTREWTQRHPYATTFIATSLALSAGVVAERSASGSEQRVATPSVNCAGQPEQCR